MRISSGSGLRIMSMRAWLMGKRSAGAASMTFVAAMDVPMATVNLPINMQMGCFTQRRKRRETRVSRGLDTGFHSERKHFTEERRAK